MPLVVRTSTLQTVTLPLACDPAIIAANPQPQEPKEGEEPKPWALAIFRRTSDPQHPAARLVVPEDACRVTLRPLSKRELMAAVAAAGERPEAVAVAWADVIDRISAEIDAGRTNAMDRAMLALTSAQREAFSRHDAWEVRHARELARASLVAISDLPDLKRGPTGFPIEQLVAMDDPAPGCDLSWPPGLDSTQLLMEVAQHVGRISTLGKGHRPEPSSASGCGAPTTTPSDGSVTARAGATDTCQGPDPSRS